MFGNKENNGTTASPNQGEVCNIAKGTSIDGNVKVAANMRLEGTIKGNVDCGGRLVMSASAKITGDITCQNLVTEGNIKGNVTVKDYLFMQSTANIHGDVSYKRIKIDEGGVIVGQLSCIATKKAAKTE